MVFWFTLLVVEYYSLHRLSLKLEVNFNDNLG